MDKKLPIGEKSKTTTTKERGTIAAEVVTHSETKVQNKDKQVQSFNWVLSIVFGVFGVVAAFFIIKRIYQEWVKVLPSLQKRK